MQSVPGCCPLGERGVRGVVKGTKDELESRIGFMITLRAGKITEMRAFGTFAEALEAAGLSE